MSDRDRFDKFTERSRRVLQYAQEEAQRFQHNYIGTEHLLLGLIRESEGVGAKVLANLGVELNKVQSAVEAIIGRGDRITLDESGLTPRGKRVIELAVDEARRLSHHYIGTEHLLLGMVREGEGIAAGVLESLGVRLENTRAATIRTLHQEELASSNESTSTQSMNTPLQVATEPIKPRTVGIVQTKSSRSYSGYPFTEQAHTVLTNAHEEALRFDHNYIGGEHLLLGMVIEGEGVASTVLHNVGVDLNRVRQAIAFIIGFGDHYVAGEIGLTPRAKRILEFASDDAHNMNNAYVGTEHLLLGLISQPEGIAAGILNSIGVELSSIRTEILRALQQATCEE